MTEKESKNPVVETYKGIQIRKYPTLRLRVSVTEMKNIIDASITTGCSPASIISAISQPYNDNDKLVTIYGKDGNEFKISKKILRKRN
jgi:hypothetical protein